MSFTAGCLTHISVSTSDPGPRTDEVCVIDGDAVSCYRSAGFLIDLICMHIALEMLFQNNPAGGLSLQMSITDQCSSGFRCNRDAPHKPTPESRRNASRTRIIHARQQYKRSASQCVSVSELINKAFIYWGVFTNHSECLKDHLKNISLIMVPLTSSYIINSAVYFFQVEHLSGLSLSLSASPHTVYSFIPLNEVNVNVQRV